MNHSSGSLDGLPAAVGVRPTNPFVEFASHEIEQSILDRFERQVACHGGRIAVVDEDQELTYAELDRWANRIAGALLDRRGPIAEPVGLLIGQAAPMVAAILGTLKAGKFYLPLEPRFPDARLKQIVAVAGTDVVIFDRAQQHRAMQLVPAPGARLDVDRAAQEYPDTPPARAVGPDHICYLLYTSGSTGQPKGVYQNHRNVLHYIREHTHACHIACSDRVALLAPFSVAASIHPLMGALLNGAALYPFDVKEHGAGPLAQWLAAQRITLYHSVPALFRQVALALPALQDLPHLRLIRLGGDLVLPADVELYRKHFAPDCLLVISFGASEAHTICWHWLDKRTPVPPDVVPVGYPVGDAKVQVLDESGQPLPAGQVGEIAVRSRHLALGYWKEPERTRAAFNDSDAMGRRTYCTGDLGRRLPDGCLVHLGRKDSRVKIRGQAVDLAEVEAALAALASVREAAVAAPPGRDGQPRLVGYVIPTADGTINSGTLKAQLSRTLPDFMVPSVFVKLDALPRTRTGKVDRQALPSVSDEHRDQGREYVMPRTPLEEQLARLWAEVLQLDQIGVHDNFFELGGHSLMASRLLARLHVAFGVDLSLRRLFEVPTVAALAAAVADVPAKGHTVDVAIPRRNAADPCPQSYAQQRLWFLDRFEPNRPVYNVSRVVRLKGTLDQNALQRALDSLIARHEALRTTFALDDGGPIQVIAASRTVPMATVDLSHHPAQTREAEVRRLLQREVLRPFDLSADVMLRAALLRLAADEQMLLLVTHHIASDGWSMAVLLRELAALYEAFAAGKPSPLTELPVQYADFALWERERLEGDRLSSLLAYWRQQLDGAPGVLELPLSRARPAVPTFEGACRSLLLPAHLVESLRALGYREGATLFMVLLAAFKVLLHRYTAQEDLVVGSPVAGRSRVELEGLIGFFTNTLALRSRLSADLSFRELLAKVRDTALGAQAHQDLPFERLVAQLRPERSLGVSPIFQVMFALQNAPRQPLQLPGLAVEPVEIDHGTAKFELTLTLVEEGGELRATVEYRTDLFEPDAMDRLLGHYQTLLEGVVADPERRIGELPVLTEPEREQLLVRWSATQSAYPDRACLHQLFEVQVERTPQAPAVVFEDQCLSYVELNACANQLAHHLRGLGAGPGTLVGLCLERGLEMVVGLLGILKAGAAFAPLDPRYPRERLALLLDDTQATLLLTQPSLAECLPQGKAQPIYLDNKADILRGQSRENPVPVASPTDLAYVIYTSGSTGKPKAAAINHGAVVNLLHAMAQEFVLREQDVLLAVSPLSFDVATMDVFLPLMLGARVVIVSREVASDGVRLSEQLTACGATVMQATPATWRLLLQAGWQGSKHLKILCGAESLPRDLADALVARGAAVWNLYGPSETTIWSTTHKVAADEEPVPIGRPIANIQVHVLDGHRQPVPIGVPGELYIGGAGLAQGYVNRPELTAEKFIGNPFSSDPEDRLYRTGDSVRWRRDGALEFLGRLDYQIKLRGFRIEPGEIEAALAEHTQVRQAVVLLREDQPGDRRLVAYVVPADVHAAAPGDLRRFLGQKLPEYMVPAVFIELQTLPQSPNGKIDRKALPAPDSARPELAGAYVAPATAVEEQLAAIWANVLGLERVGIHDNFFELGGHSLLAVQLFARMEKQFHQRLPLAVLFQHGTIASLARLLAKPASATPDVSVVALQESRSDSTPLFLIPSLGGELLFARLLIQHLGRELPVYGLQPRLTADVVKRFADFEATAAGYLQALREFQPQGSYALAGYSYGGLLAYEIARQVREQGGHVSLLAVLDTGPGRRGLPPRNGPRGRRLVALVRNLPYWLVEEGLRTSPVALLQRGKRYARRLLRRWLGRFGSVTPQAEFSDAFDDVDRIPTQNRELMAALWQAFRVYVPKPYPGRVTLFRARTRSLFDQSPTDLGWSRLAQGGVDVRIIPGHHESILREPHIQMLARELKEALAASRGTGCSLRVPEDAVDASPVR
jgi:amino acid adenylation domain-containing protein